LNVFKATYIVFATRQRGLGPVAIGSQSMRRSLPPRIVTPSAPNRVDWDFVRFWVAYFGLYFEVVWLLLR